VVASNWQAKSIVTVNREYLPSDNTLPMAVELGMANQYSIDLGIDVTRGMKSKADKGCGQAKRH